MLDEFDDRLLRVEMMTRTDNSYAGVLSDADRVSIAAVLDDRKELAARLASIPGEVEPAVTTCVWAEAAIQCDEILTAVNELPDAAEEFGESVREKVESMMEWIQENERVTPDQLEALDNMERGVRKWLR